MKFYLTPWGWLRALICISLFAGAAFVHGPLVAVMIIVGMGLLVYSYWATINHLKKAKK